MWAVQAALLIKFESDPKISRVVNKDDDRLGIQNGLGSLGNQDLVKQTMF